MLRFVSVPHYAKRPRKAVSVYDEYGKKAEEPIKTVRFEEVAVSKKKKKRKASRK